MDSSVKRHRDYGARARGVTFLAVLAFGAALWSALWPVRTYDSDCGAAILLLVDGSCQGFRQPGLIRACLLLALAVALMVWAVRLRRKDNAGLN